MDNVIIRLSKRLLSLWPRSFSGLILLCLLLVAVPLVVPMLYGAASINHLSKQGRQIVLQAEQTERNGKALSNQLEKMEHSVKLSGILGDASLLANYYQSHDKFREALSALAALPLTQSQITLLGSVTSSDADIFDQVKRFSARHGKPGNLRVDFTPLKESVSAFLSQVNVLAEGKMDTMQAMADDASQITIWSVTMMIPFAILLAVSAARLITTPIRQISRAIETVGSGELSHPVRIDGPQDLRRLGEQLEWMRISLLELEKQKTTFLQHVSHELKTPLASIREGTELLREGIAGPMTEMQNEIAAILHANSIQLQKRIEDLLNFSALQSGKAVLAKKRVELNPLIEDVIRSHRLALENKGLRVGLACPHLEADADEQKLRIIVDNLLSNAIKYSAPDGKIEISVAEIGGSICLDVADSGCGIAEEDKQHIFDAFYQGRNPPQGGMIKGTGLGLAISREYVLAHGGQIQLVDQSKGARFRVSLPRYNLMAIA